MPQGFFCTEANQWIEAIEDEGRREGWSLV